MTSAHPRRRLVRPLDDLHGEYITIRELAYHCHCGREQVRKWILAGALPAVLLDCGWRIKASDAKAFIAQHAYAPAEGRGCA